MKDSLRFLVTVFFFSLLLFLALRIPVRARGLQDPIFYEAFSSPVHFKPEMGIFRSYGLGLSNINGRSVISVIPQQRERGIDDLKLSFDGSDSFGNYTLINKGVELNPIQKIAGASSGKFAREGSTLVLMPDERSVLAESGLSLQSFTIDFWLYPYRTGEGSQSILEFRGKNYEQSLDPRTYGVSIIIEKNTLVYRLENFFRDKDTNTYSFELKERQTLHRNQWERHTFVLDAAAAVLRIYRNGVEQQVIPVTSGRIVDGVPLFPSDHITASKKRFPVLIGKNALFSLDEFSISRDVHTNFQDHRTPPFFFETDVLAVSTNSSYLYKVHVDGSFPKQSGRRLAYRFSTNYFFPETNSIPWIYIDPEKDIFPPSRSLGRYVQWRFEYTPPVVGDASMELYGLDAFVRENRSPAALKLDLVGVGDGSIDLTWNALADPNIRSYEIYYGTKPGNYFGVSTISSSSPVVISAQESLGFHPMQFRLEGLENEKAYYVVIRVRDKFGKLGAASSEIYVRPSVLKSAPYYSIGR